MNLCFLGLCVRIFEKKEGVFIMINIRKDDLKKLRCVGGGGFGKLYKKGDLVYKIYNNMVPSGYTTFVNNPSLRYRRFRLNRLLSLDKKVIYSDLIKDIIYVDGKFAGVCLPFYDGLTLDYFEEAPLEKRIDLSFELVRNFRELTDYYIYPMDFRMDNAMKVDGHVKLIDLDDFLTKVSVFPRRDYLKEFVGILDNNIKGFLQEYSNFNSPRLVKMLDKVDYPFNYSYEGIFNYLTDKSEKHSYVLIGNDSDILSNISLLRDSNIRNIYVRPNVSELADVIRSIARLNELGISIYDVVMNGKCDMYLNNVCYDDIYQIYGDKVYKRM